MELIRAVATVRVFVTCWRRARIVHRRTSARRSARPRRGNLKIVCATPASAHGTSGWSSQVCLALLQFCAQCVQNFDLLKSSHRHNLPPHTPSETIAMSYDSNGYSLMLWCLTRATALTTAVRPRHDEDDVTSTIEPCVEPK